MVGARTNLSTDKKAAKKAANKAAREAKKAQKEADAAARKIENAGKPKNGDYARFCKWKKVIEGEIEEAGFENKRDYNKHLWGVGLGDADSVEWEGPWEDFKKSELAPWNQSQIEC
jgi:hypothetical protein